MLVILYVTMCLLQFFYIPCFEIRPYLVMDSVFHLLNGPLELKDLLSLSMFLNHVTESEARIKWQGLLKKHLLQEGFPTPLLFNHKDCLPTLSRSGLMLNKERYDECVNLSYKMMQYRRLPYVGHSMSVDGQERLKVDMQHTARHHLLVNDVVPQLVAPLLAMTNQPLPQDIFKRGLQGLKHCPAVALDVVATSVPLYQSEQQFVSTELIAQRECWETVVIQTVLDRLHEFKLPLLLRFCTHLVVKRNNLTGTHFLGIVLIERIVELIKQEPVPHELLDKAVATCINTSYFSPELIDIYARSVLAAANDFENYHLFAGTWMMCIALELS